MFIVGVNSRPYDNVNNYRRNRSNSVTNLSATSTLDSSMCSASVGLNCKTKDTLAIATVNKLVGKLNPSNNGVDSYDDELPYGPGIVAKLRSKFLQYSLQTSQKQTSPSTAPASSTGSSNLTSSVPYGSVKRCTSVNGVGIKPVANVKPIQLAFLGGEKWKSNELLNSQKQDNSSGKNRDGNGIVSLLNQRNQASSSPPPKDNGNNYTSTLKTPNSHNNLTNASGPNSFINGSNNKCSASATFHGNNKPKVDSNSQQSLVNGSIRSNNPRNDGQISEVDLSKTSSLNLKTAKDLDSNSLVNGGNHVHQTASAQSYTSACNGEISDKQTTRGTNHDVVDESLNKDRELSDSTVTAITSSSSWSNVAIKSNTASVTNNLGGTTMIFDFRNKNVRANVAVRTPPSRPSLSPKDASEEDDIFYNGSPELPQPCEIVFIGENIIIGKGSLLVTRNKKLTTTFDDDATETYEYPSETCLLEEASPPSSPIASLSSSDADENGVNLNSATHSTSPSSSQASSSLKNNTVLGSNHSGWLASYVPTFLNSAETSFELGVSRMSKQEEKTREKSPLDISDVNEDCGDGFGLVKPASSSETSSWSTSSTALDLLF